MQIEDKDSLILSFERVTAMFLIILCHLSSAVNINALGQVFNVGIYVFFILSGYLFSFKEISNPIFWFQERMKKIMIPCYIYYVISALILFVLGKLGEISIIKAIKIVLNLQGLCGGSIGNVVTGHLWFLSFIMICYVTTPILQCINSSKKRVYPIITILVLIILGIISAFIYGGFFAHTAGIVVYAIMYFYGKQLLNVKYRVTYPLSFIFMVIAVTLRVIFLTLTVNPEMELLYTNLIVPYTHMFLGWWIFITIYMVSDKLFLILTKMSKTIKFLAGISFEVYITHYMFLVGVLSELSKNIIVNLMTFLLGTIGYSLILYCLKKIISTMLYNKKGSIRKYVSTKCKFAE
jgi:peptidoglycan/LPS O-acetylase OafA/YrhL